VLQNHRGECAPPELLQAALQKPAALTCLSACSHGVGPTGPPAEQVAAAWDPPMGSPKKRDPGDMLSGAGWASRVSSCAFRLAGYRLYISTGLAFADRSRTPGEGGMGKPGKLLCILFGCRLHVLMGLAFADRSRTPGKGGMGKPGKLLCISFGWLSAACINGSCICRSLEDAG
jgi:hypothetical protein